MKKRKQDLIESYRKERRKERQFTAMMIFFVGAMGVIAGRCSNPNQNPINVKHGVVSSDSRKSFQPGDTIKVILINEKQR